MHNPSTPNRDPERLTLAQAATLAGAATFEVARAVTYGDLPATTTPEGRMTVTESDVEAWIARTLRPSREFDRRREGTPWDLVGPARAGFERQV